jgi:hypothetical protein
MDIVWSNAPIEALTPVIHGLRDQNRVGNLPLTIFRLTEEETFHGVRCPLCAWRPDASSRWSCEPSQSPEPSFPGCLTVWNTFSTRGRCPGCDHQWRWTSCLSCHGWSLHEDWYESADKRTNH